MRLSLIHPNAQIGEVVQEKHLTVTERILFILMRLEQSAQKKPFYF